MGSRVLILTDYPLSPDRIRGGIPRSLYSTTQAIRRLAPDIEFHVCTLSADVKRSCVKTEDNLVVHYIRYPLVDAPLIAPKQLTDYLFGKKIREIAPNLLHAQGTGKDYGYPAVQARFSPTVYTVHGVINQESKHWEGIKGRYHAVTGSRMERYVLRHARHVVAVSPYVQRTVAPFTTADISVIFNPVEPKFFDVPKREVPNRLLFVGGIEERKGLETLVRAVRLLIEEISEVEVHIVGGVRKVLYHERIKRLVRDLELDDNVRFLSHLSDEDLMREYAEASVFVLPSKEESQGIVLVEAMATGTPVVATDAGGMPDVVEDGRNGFLVSVGDARAMADRIGVLLGDTELRRTFGAEGRAMAAQYLPERIAEQHLELYRRLLTAPT